MPENQEIAVEFDDNDNLKELVPPGRPAHAFVTDERQHQGQYLPPAVDMGSQAYVAHYDLDGLLFHTELPGEQSVQVLRDKAGRPVEVSVPSGR